MVDKVKQIAADQQLYTLGPRSELLANAVVAIALIVATAVMGWRHVFSGDQALTVYTGITAWLAGRSGGRAAERKRQNNGNGYENGD